MTKLSDICPTKPCTRCGGSGEYSYNERDGVRCWGCNGSGEMWADDATARAVAAWREAKQLATNPTVADLVPGDLVVLDRATFDRPTLRQRFDTTNEIATVDHVEPTELVVGAEGVRVTGLVGAPVVKVVLADGTECLTTADSMVRRRCDGVTRSIPGLREFLKAEGITPLDELAAG